LLLVFSNSDFLINVDFLSKIVDGKVYIDIFVVILTGYLQSVCI